MSGRLYGRKAIARKSSSTITASRRYTLQDEQFLSDRLVRALVHLKKFEEAQQAAEASTKKRYSDRILPVLVAASTGDANKTLAAIEKARPTRFNLQRFYQDPDLGPMLRAEGFRTVRDRYPEPPTNEFDGGRFQDDFFDCTLPGLAECGIVASAAAAIVLTRHRHIVWNGVDHSFKCMFAILDLPRNPGFATNRDDPELTRIALLN